MLEGYKILTVTHQHTHLSEIANYVVQDAEGDALREKLEGFKEKFDLPELMYMATCNRVMYCFYTENKLDDNFRYRFFQAVNPKLSANDLFLLDKKASFLEGEAALKHIYDVASSVVSLVVGEREILRQLKDAYKQSHTWGLTGDNLRIAFQSAIVSAKSVYAKTRIGEKPVSVVSLAIQQLMQTELPKDARILMIGAGQTNTLVMKFLKKYEYTNVAVFNRTEERATSLARMVAGTAHALPTLPHYQKGFDCLIVCTGATKAVINSDLYRHILQGDTTKKVVIDLSIPNNVAAEVVEDFDVNYIGVEDLRALAKENLAFREKEVEKVKILLAQDIQKFHNTYQERRIERAMKNLPSEIKAIKSHAMTNVFAKDMEHLDENARAILEKMMTYMEKKCISIPMKTVKQALLKDKM